MGNSTAMWTLVQREVTRFLRIWTQSLIPPVLTSTLFILIFGYSLGSRITGISGVSYLEFIVPGLLMMGVIMSAYTSSAFSLFISKFHGSIQEVLIAPISYWQIIAAFTIAAILRASIVGLGILAVSLIFTSITIYNIGILIYFVVMTAMLFAFAGIATALWAYNFDQLNVFTTFVITPLTYLGGVFYSISMLPEFWSNVAKFNPVLYMVDGFRYGFIGLNDVPIIYSMFLVLILTTLFFLICVQMFRKGYKLRT